MEYFRADPPDYRIVNPESKLIKEYMESGERGKVFFQKGIPEGWVDLDVDSGLFLIFEDAYTRLMVDLSVYLVQSIGLILAKRDTTKHLYITGGFAKNSIFTTILSCAFPDKQIFISEVDNASSLGAALVIVENVWKASSDYLNLGLTSPVPHHPHH